MMRAELRTCSGSSTLGLKTGTAPPYRESSVRPGLARNKAARTARASVGAAGGGFSDSVRSPCGSGVGARWAWVRARCRKRGKEGRAMGCSSVYRPVSVSLSSWLGAAGAAATTPRRKASAWIAPV